MKVLLAVGTPELSALFKNHLSASDHFDLLDQDVMHRNFLAESVAMETPDCIILHADQRYLPSELSTQEEQDQEILQLIEYWRSEFPNLRVVVIAIRERQDPFLSNLVARNVLDIFNEISIDVELFIQQLSVQPQYKNVRKFGIGEYDRHQESSDDEAGESNHSRASDKESTQDDTSRSIPNELKMKGSLLSQKVISNVSGKVKQLKEQRTAKQAEKESQLHTKQNTKVASESETVAAESDEEQADSTSGSGRRSRSEQHRSNKKIHMPQPKELLIQEKLVGTVTVAVAGLDSRVGSTHTSIGIAALLQESGSNVAIIEGNTSGTFSAIQQIHDNPSEPDGAGFIHKGVKYFPHDQETDLIHLYGDYDYIILDLGNYQTSPWFHEFFRAQKRIVVGDYAEWHFDQLMSFVKQHHSLPFDVVIPYANDELIEDLKPIEVKHEGRTRFFSLPFHSNPNHTLSDYHEVLKSVVGSFMTSKKVYSVNQKGYWKVVMTSAATTSVVLGGIYWFLLT